MDVHVNDEIDCVLLFDHFHPPVDVESVLAFLAATFRDAAFALAAGEPEETSFLLNSDASMFVHVAQNRRPLPPENLRQALHSPYQQIMCPRIDEAVAEHTLHLIITVSHKPPIPGFINPGFKVSNQSAQLVAQKISICQHLANHLAATLGATAVHWCQSNLILSPDQFSTAVADPRYPSPLHIHPQLFSSGESADGEGSIAFRTMGARHVIGREILFSECPADVRWMQDRAMLFLEKARRDDGLLIPDGESFGVSADEVIRVRHRPPVGDDVPLIELTVEKSLEQGIGLATPSMPAALPPERPVFGRRKPL